MLFDKMPALPYELAAMDEKQTAELCADIRKRLIETVSVNGGHLASNLGVVELTVALYSVYDPHKDRIIWDVGHQSYVHKILTGRDAGMDHLRHPEGTAGFPKLSESDADAFNTGHSSTSVSAAIGYARGYELSGEKRHVIAVIGDGALTGGMAYEALNDLAQSGSKVTVVLNDNGMSINKNVGGLAKYLGKIRKKHSYLRAKKRLRHFLEKIPGIGKPIARLLTKIKNRVKHWVVEGKFFENLGLYYLGPVDGHDVYAMKMIFERVNELDGPVLVHVQTHKGHGYEPAEKNPEAFHGVPGFDPETGEIFKSGGCSLSKCFSETLCDLAREDEKIIAVTAAMSIGTGLQNFADAYPGRLFDVGIAEPHAITMAAGLALAGRKPVAAIYSTFLQRAYDQILHDVALQKLPLVISVDRAGVCGPDGETHHGIYDFAYIGAIPFTTISAPSSAAQLDLMLRMAVKVYDEDSVIPENSRLFVIRYPAKERFTYSEDPRYIKSGLEYGKGAICFDNRLDGEKADVVIFSIGEVLEEAFAAAIIMADRGLKAVVFDAKFFKPLDEDAIVSLAAEAKVVAACEDAVKDGGFCEKVTLLLSDKGVGKKPVCFALPNELIPNDTIKNQLSSCGISGENIAKVCMGLL
ncbi:MAG: 1-deoxy-D-xylulose-5-phosphate synthase [Clostridia bacterium]|nr:1-deoxy-D-xylulose-5-phosphate synthase [Clostridia bacterium]